MASSTATSSAPPTLNAATATATKQNSASSDPHAWLAIATKTNPLALLWDRECTLCNSYPLILYAGVLKGSSAAATATTSICLACGLAIQQAGDWEWKRAINDVGENKAPATNDSKSDDSKSDSKTTPPISQILQLAKLLLVMTLPIIYISFQASDSFSSLIKSFDVNVGKLSIQTTCGIALDASHIV